MSYLKYVLAEVAQRDQLKQYYGRAARNTIPVFTFFEESGPWPPKDDKLLDRMKELMYKTPNIMHFGNEKMGGVSTFSDEEIERAYNNMLARRGGLPPSGRLPVAPNQEELIEKDKRIPFGPQSIFLRFRASDTLDSATGEPAQSDQT